MYLELSDSRVPAAWRTEPNIQRLMAEGYRPHWDDEDNYLSMRSTRSEVLSVTVHGAFSNCSVMGSGGRDLLSPPAPAPRTINLGTLPRYDEEDREDSTPRYLATAPSKEELAKRLQAKFIHRRDHHYSPHLKRSGDAAKPLLACYVTLFDCLSTDAYRGCREVIRPGAFSAVLAANPYVRALAGHHDDMHVADTGRGTMALGEDEIGLFAIVDPNNTEYGRDLLRCLRAGDLHQHSFRLSPADEHAELFYLSGARCREITRVDSLEEISFVPVGVFSQTLCVVADEKPRLEPFAGYDERRQRFMALERRQRNINLANI